MSRAHPVLIATSLAALAGALVLVISPVAATLGFVPVPSGLTLTIVAIIVAYLVSAEVAKYVADRRVGGAEKSVPRRV
jgi:Mg2+-importing ATPase